MYLFFSVLLFVWNFAVSTSSSITLDIYYPNEGLLYEQVLNQNYNIFSLGYSTSPYDLQLAEQYDGMYFPWFGNYTYFVNNVTHYVEDNHWQIVIPIGDEVEGEVYVTISSNFFGNTVKVCEMYYSFGTCQPRGSPYKVILFCY